MADSHAWGRTGQCVDPCTINWAVTGIYQYLGHQSGSAHSLKELSPAENSTVSCTNPGQFLKELSVIPAENSTVLIAQLPRQADLVSDQKSVSTTELTSETIHWRAPSASASRDTLAKDVEATLQRIAHLAKELDGQCSVCWVNGEVQRAHHPGSCDSRVCTGNGWRSFKAKINFPSGLICPLCLALYGPPFNHRKPLPGSRYIGEFCDYTDILKKLAYTVYRKQEIRKAIFDKLGHSTPSTVASYRRFVGKKSAGGLLGVYQVLDAYLDLREAGRPGLTT